MLAHGGFYERGQVAFVLLAGAALATCVVVAPGDAMRAFALPAAIALAALAALTASSAVWTDGEGIDALRWGAVVAGYAAMLVCGAVASRRCGSPAVAAVVLLLAAGSALLGLAGVALHELPYAERIGGSWRPGGPFEYGPALGALQLAALPLAMRLAASPKRSIVGAAAGAIAAAAIALISSRIVLALGLLLLVAVVAAPRATIGRERPLAVALACFLLSTAMAADAVAGSYAEPYVETADAPRIAGLLVLLAVAPALWLFTARRFTDAGGLRRGAKASAAAMVLVPLVASAAAAAATPDSGSGVEPDSGVTHGRLDIWGDAVETAASGPALGTGALTFLRTQLAAGDDPGARFAHDLPIEAWVELGYPGLLVSLAFVAAVAAALVASRGDPAAWLLGPGTLAFLVAALIDWHWHVPAAGALFAFTAGALAMAPGGKPRAGVLDPRRR